MGLPSALGFGIYHSDHHNYLGEDGKDPDLPTMFEVRNVKSTFAKCLFFLFLSLIYAFRPFIFMHKKMTVDEIVNFIVIICTDLIIYKFWGIGALAFILITGFISIGAHPAAIHVIA
jgi:sphingolipid delta-4 desaturase